MENEMDWPLRKAARDGDVKFLKKAVAVQPPEYFLTLTSYHYSNIIHYAVSFKKPKFVKEAVKILPTKMVKQLLLMGDKDLNTPLHLAAFSGYFSAIKCIREKCESLSWDDADQVKPWLALNKNNETPWNCCLEHGGVYGGCAMEIMLMDPQLESCTIANNKGNTPLLNVVRLLLERCDGWLDNDGNTPLHSALHSTSTEEHALEILSTYPALCKIRNNKGESPFLLAVRSGYVQVVDEILRIEEQRFHMLRSNDGTTVLHSLSSVPEKTGQMLVRKYWWLNNLRDYQGRTALDYAKQQKTDWLVKLLTNPSLIKKQDFDWIEAWEREESEAVFAFARNCENLRPFLIRNATPLHHAKLATCKDYIKFLKIPSIADLKNTTDNDGATPLHRALERKDMDFAKALLLDNGVKRLIRDRAGKTPMDLLAKLCKENTDWEKMCKEIKVNLYLRTSYIQPGTNLEQMRTTLSVIAALLATITFAAGFTLPGGINSDNGQALLGKKAAFLVFLLADAYAMCTSMLVLFCLVWSMVSEPDMASLLVDRSVFILMQSLYATLLVFMTGIYVVIEHTSLWAAIAVFVMCSLIGITANRTILHKVIAMLVPAAYREKLDQMRLLEEGNAGAFTTEEDNTDKRE